MKAMTGLAKNGEMISDVTLAGPDHIMRLKKAEAMKQAVRGIVYRTIALIVFIGIAVYLFNGNNPLNLPFNASALFLPLAIAAIAVYASSLVGVLLTGSMAVPLHNALRIFALTAFFTLFVMSPVFTSGIKNLAFPIFFLGLIWALHVISRAYSELTGVITRSLLIAGAGFFYYVAFISPGLHILTETGLIILIVFISVAAFSLMGVFRKHDNEYVSYVGKVFANIANPAMIGMAVAAILTYLIFIRPSIQGLGTVFVTALEWVAMCAAIALLFLKVRSSIRSIAEAQKFGEGHAVARKLCYSEEALDRVAALVKDFVEDGRKSGLIAYTAAMLTGNGLPPETTRDVISVIIDHMDEPEPLAMLAWTAGDIRMENRRKRQQAVDRMIAAADSAMELYIKHGRSDLSTNIIKPAATADRETLHER